MWIKDHQKEIAMAAVMLIVLAIIVYQTKKSKEGFILAKNLPTGAILEKDWIQRANEQQGMARRELKLADEALAISRKHMTPAQAAYMSGFDGAN